ncbi:VCBS repeat-containing protein [Thioalkalicoccus limnaeus]|uniref:VCBS repeat-containing protein n=1 Tax=Thioalkalicoccus limnaeus TaxID=120681 RepID=A0ABV4BBG5_9GAMM
MRHLIKPLAWVAPIVLTLAAGCTAERVDDSAEDPPTSLMLAPELSVWGGALIRRDDGTWLGTALHDVDEFGVWRIDGDRKATLIGRFPTGYHPDGVAVWDSDRFVVAVEGTRMYQFWRIDDGRMRLEGEAEGPLPARDLVVADFDGDGLPDLVLAPYGGEELALLWGQGGIGLSDAQSLPAGRSPWHPQIVDWDGDGRPDLLWAELDTGVVRLARNLGARRFEVEAVHGVSGVTPRHLAARDLSGDGRPDLVAIAVEIGAAELLTPRSDGGLEVAKLPPVGALGYVAAAILADGTILLAEEGRVILARAVGAEWEKRTLPAGSLPSPIELFDVDGDGEEDLVVYGSARSGVIIHFGPLWERAEPLGIVQAP